jgi:hypothetical protein
MSLLDQLWMGVSLFAFVGSTVALAQVMRLSSYPGTLLCTAGMLLGGWGVAHGLYQLATVIHG